MLVKCIYDQCKDLPKDCLDPKSGYTFDEKFYLDINKAYSVYGLIIKYGYIWYILFTKNQTYYPYWYPSPLFDVIDGRLSKYWIYSFGNSDKKDSLRNIWTFPEWANDLYYYDRLTDGEEDDIRIFQKYKTLMDVEFPNPDISEKASVLDDQWLMCPICIDGWKSNNFIDGMVVCPKCKTIMHNPRYSLSN